MCNLCCTSQWLARNLYNSHRQSSCQVVEMAPAYGLDDKVRAALHRDAVKLCKFLDYQNAGTVEFMVDKHGDYFFLEVNPRIQVASI